MDEALATLLSGLGIDSLQDLLFYLPRRWQDRTRVHPVATLCPGTDAVVEGQILSTSVVQGRKRMLLCRIEDGSGQLLLRFFHFSSTLQNSLAPGICVRCFGTPRAGRHELELCHPELELFDPDCRPPLPSRLTPVYPLVEGLKQDTIRHLCEQALAWLETPDALQEYLPPDLLQAHGLWPLADAVGFLHAPPPTASTADLTQDRHPARRRLAFEELLAHQLGLLRMRGTIRSQPGISLAGGEACLRQHLKQQLPFALTQAQQRVAADIARDLASSTPMLRLIQGDVGSGKTILAALAVLQAIESGCQAALMAPTEILAVQHHKTFCSWLEPLGIEPVLLTGKTRVRRRRETLACLASGEAPVVLGTHALFQDDLQFAHLALVVIDEQHKFGVHQRLALASKGDNCRMPHQLIMTATPIPRTLAMSAYADLDLSVIDELPPGRSPITTLVVSDNRRQQVIDRIHAACQQGRQAYWVCTLIDESDALEFQAAETVAQSLQTTCPDLTIGLVHGRLSQTEKTRVMTDFSNGQIQLLVATTVIEVGVDVPNASLMVIEDPERLGLAQLHQLRGRIGRGDLASHCILLYRAPLSRQGRTRLQVMRESCDGFAIADRDLELRGPGELLGTRQTGAVQFRIADLSRDAALLEPVREAASRLLQQAPDQARLLMERWLPQADLCARA